jgi:hypothetical protein
VNGFWIEDFGLRIEDMENGNGREIIHNKGSLYASIA